MKKSFLCFTLPLKAYQQYKDYFDNGGELLVRFKVVGVEEAELVGDGLVSFMLQFDADGEMVKKRRK